MRYVHKSGVVLISGTRQSCKTTSAFRMVAGAIHNDKTKNKEVVVCFTEGVGPSSLKYKSANPFLMVTPHSSLKDYEHSDFQDFKKSTAERIENVRRNGFAVRFMIIDELDVFLHFLDLSSMEGKIPNPTSTQVTEHKRNIIRDLRKFAKEYDLTIYVTNTVVVSGIGDQPELEPALEQEVDTSFINKFYRQLVSHDKHEAVFTIKINKNRTALQPFEREKFHVVKDTKSFGERLYREA